MSGTCERRVFITGRGMVCPLGDNPEAMLGALEAGRASFPPITRFEDQHPGPCRGAELRDFEPQRYLGQGNLRPLDRTSRLSTVAAQLALQDSGFSPEVAQEQELGLVLGTMFGSVHTISAFDRRAISAGPVYAKPMDFANSVINAAAGQTAIWHGLRGVNSTVAGGTAAGLLALSSATDLIRNGRAETLLAGGAEELCFESWLGMQRAGHLADQEADAPNSLPMDRDRHGMHLSEGAALLVLEEEEQARSGGRRPLARVLGHASVFDPSRGRDQEQAAEAVCRAVRVAMEDGEVQPERLVALSLSASGRRDGDRHEALGLAKALGEHAGTLPLLAVKGLLGECLGASGAFQTLVLVEACRRGRLAGLQDHQPDPDLPLGRRLGEGMTELSCGPGLVLSAGLDGMVAALLVEALPG